MEHTYIFPSLEDSCILYYAPAGTYTNHFYLIERSPGEWSIEISTTHFADILAEAYHYYEKSHTFSLRVEDPEPPKKKKGKTKPKKKYKPADKKVHSVPATMPERFRIVRKFPSNPLDTLPELPTNPPEFVPGKRYTEERKKEMDINPDGFLTPEEEKLVHHLISVHEDAFAWDESEKGYFREEYFEPIEFPVLAHTPWAHKNIPIPPGIQNQVIKILKEKIASGVYEHSNSSYRSRWFCVPKKDGFSLRIVHDLQPLNAVTVRDSGCPPVVEIYAESFGGYVVYAIFDLMVGFDHRLLHILSRDFTTFQTPLGPLRHTRLPQGYTNAVQIQQGDLTFILQDEIPHITQPFLDDIPIKGPSSYYLLPNGQYETIPGNPQIRRFIFEHLVNVNRIVHRIRHAGGTFNARKSIFAAPKVMIVGHVCSALGRTPDESKVQKIRDWPTPEELTDVRAFLGTLGLMRIFIKDFAYHASPLVALTRKNVDFSFGIKERAAMDSLKELLINSPALIRIEHHSGRLVILAVDSSYIAAGFILLQVGEDGKEYPSRFGSITWNERESRYSQAKIELYGLFRALKAYRIYIAGAPKLLVRSDAKYLKGMLNNPDVQPNATINRWIAGIKLFDFDFEHTSGAKFPPDGLSRRKRAPEDPEEEDDVEDWIDRACGFAIQLINWPAERRSSLLETVPAQRLTVDNRPLPSQWRSVYRPPQRSRQMICVSVFVNSVPESEEEIPRTKAAVKQDEDLEKIAKFLEDLKRPPKMTDQDYERFARRVLWYFVDAEGRLWRRDINNRHKLVVPKEKRMSILRQVHDSLGHKAYFVTRSRLLDRFWWPMLNQDVRWFCDSCRQCQERSKSKVLLPPTVALPLPLFAKAYMDTMYLPAVGGFRYVAHARCSLSSYPEWRKLRQESASTLAAFIFEDILCRWGAVAEIVTDNGKPWVAAVEYLSKKYGINHIRISSYNSPASGPIERRHYDVREALAKATDHDLRLWPIAIHYVFWAERVTVQKSTGYSPYYIAHGVEPLFPFDILEATYMSPGIQEGVSTEELIAHRARRLWKRDEDLEDIAKAVYKSRNDSARRMEMAHAKQIKVYDFAPGSLVLLRNNTVEKSLDKKTKRRYGGPYLVVKRTSRGNYVISELDGSILASSVAAFRLIPYLSRSKITKRLEDVVDLTPDQIEQLKIHEEDAQQQDELVDELEDNYFNYIA